MTSSAPVMISFLRRKDMGTYPATFVAAAFMIALFVISGLWFEANEPLYRFSNRQLVAAIHLGNGVVTMLMILMTTGVYANTARRLERSLTFTASHDALTGLVNRGKMSELLEEWAGKTEASLRDFGDAKRKTYAQDESRGRGCIALMDIDYFKKINDKYGHQAGDCVLRAFADSLRGLEAKKPGVVCSRWGGEEFVVLIPGASKEEATALVDTFRGDVARQVVKFESDEIGFSITAGVASLSECASVEELVSIADKRLYEGKESGRNKVVA